MYTAGLEVEVEWIGIGAMVFDVLRSVRDAIVRCLDWEAMQNVGKGMIRSFHLDHLRMDV